MIRRLVLFGATGDLAGRFLLPALAALHAAGKLSPGFRVVGSATQDWEDEAFRRHVAQKLEQHAAGVPVAAREVVLRSLSYRRVNFDDPRSVTDVIASAGEAAAGARPGPLAAYLALPPRVFPVAVPALGAAGLPQGSRIVLEKPFGDDLESAMALNRLLARVAGAAGEKALFRVDHVLGMPAVRNLIGLRLANRVLESVWNSAHIAQVDILWEETLALEGRAGFYDHAGALKDVLQNHMFQLLCLVAMEPPASLGEKELRDRKVEVLRSVRPLSPADVTSRTRRARYTAGQLGGSPDGSGRVVPAYAEEKGVDPKRGTETFAELVLELDTPRWAGTRFLLRAGKALRRRRKEVVVRFRPLPHQPFGEAAAPTSNELRIGVDGPEDLTLLLTGSTADLPARPVPLSLTAPLPPAALPAYGHVLLDILSGGSTLSVRDDEAEQAWRVLTPVLQAWAHGRVPMQEYPAGSDGP